jgi:hypothetical protein
MKSELKDKIYIALTSYGDEFVEALESETFANDPSDFAALENYIKHHFEPIEGKVSINGNIYTTTVYKPVLENDFFYVKTDLNKVPIGSVALRVENSLELHCYLSNLKTMINKAEAFSEDLELNINDYFVKPNFRLLKYHTKELISWDYLPTFGRLMIVGSPGSGKTTCLRKLALDFADNKNIDVLGAIIPVYLSMRQFGEKEFSFSSIQEAFDLNDAPGLANAVPTLIDNGGLILFLDGLDEVNDKKRDKILNQVKHLCQKNPRMRIVISMRYSEKQQEFGDFTQLEIAPFNNSQIKHWTYQVIQNRKPWNQFIDHLLETPEILELARNPLMLSTAISLFLRYSHTPHNRIALLERYLDVLIEDWDSVRNVNRSNEIWSSPNKKIFYLCNLAHHLNSEDKSHFTLYEFKKWNNSINEESSDDKLLSSLAEDTGLLRQIGKDQWSFIHESILRYLAARYLVDCTIDVNEFFVEKLTETRYQKTWSNVCGIAYDSSRLIDKMLQTKEVNPQIKLMLLSAIFSEEIKTNENFALKYFQFMRNGIEKYLKEALLKDFKASELGLSEDLIVRNALVVEIKTGNEEPSKNVDISLFVNLIKNLYKLRRTTIGKLIGKEFVASSFEPVMQFASIFQWEGKLNHKIVENGENALIAFFVLETDDVINFSAQWLPTELEQ